MDGCAVLQVKGGKGVGDGLLMVHEEEEVTFLGYERFTRTKDSRS